MKITPVGCGILVQLLKPQNKTGILIVNQNSSDPIEALVISVGEDVEIPIKKDMKILLTANCGMKMKGGTEDEPRYLIQEHHVIGIINE